MYNINVRAYHTLRSYLARILSPVQAFDFENFSRLENAQGINFYELRTKSLYEKLESLHLSEKEKEKTLQLNSELKTPFYTDYYAGYDRFFVMMSTSALFIILALSICNAPVFAEEFQKKTDSVILSSKYGKSKLIKAKIFTTLTFSLLFIIVSLIVAVIITFVVYGTYGGDVSFQMLNLYSVYPLTMIKAMLIYCFIIVCVSLFISVISLALSANLSTFATIITLMTVLMGSMFFSIPFENLRTFNLILPAKMFNVAFVFSDRLVSVFGMYFKPYIFIPVFCLLMICIIIPFSYKSFKNHQVK